uniref:Uncharacterized protein n=1 Tax=Armadillidium vulgare clopovirus TaxID=2984284 RepID=A0A9C7C9M8_9VIRU|nr:MAG: hypothetical protein [Armadillidium vulgare clopovirus]
MYQDELYFFENREFQADEFTSLSFKCRKNGTHCFTIINKNQKRFNLNLESLQQVLRQLSMFSKEERRFCLRVSIEENMRNLGEKSEGAAAAAEEEEDDTDDDFEVVSVVKESSLTTPQRKKKEESKKNYINLTMKKYQRGEGIDTICLQDKGYKFYLNGAQIIQHLIDLESEIEKFIFEFQNYQKILHYSEESLVKFYTNVRIEEGIVDGRKRFLDTSDESESVHLRFFLRSRRMMDDFKSRLGRNMSRKFFSSSAVPLGCIVYLLSHRDFQFNKMSKLISNNKKLIRKCVVV